MKTELEKELQDLQNRIIRAEDEVMAYVENDTTVAGLREEWRILDEAAEEAEEAHAEASDALYKQVATKWDLQKMWKDYSSLRAKLAEIERGL